MGRRSLVGWLPLIVPAALSARDKQKLQKLVLSAAMDREQEPALYRAIEDLMQRAVFDAVIALQSKLEQQRALERVGSKQ